jgi:hypothetical protein
MYINVLLVHFFHQDFKQNQKSTLKHREMSNQESRRKRKEDEEVDIRPIQSLCK